MLKKYLILIIISFCIMLSMCACRSSESSSEVSSTESSKPVVSMYDLRVEMLKADEDFPEMSFASSSDENASDLFTYISEMDYEKVDSYFLAYSSEGLADEIAVIAVKNESDVKTAELSLKAHVDDRVNLYTQYDPEQAPRAQDALVFTHGRYAVLIISDNKGDVKSAFEAFVENN